MSGKLVVGQAKVLVGSEPLVEAAKKYVAASRAANTRRDDERQWKRFCAWCDDRQMSPLPAEPTTLVLFITWLAELPRSVSRIEQALAAISQAHRLAGHEPTRDDRLVRETLKGIRRTKGVAPKQKKPLLTRHIREISDALPEPSLVCATAPF